MDSDAWVKYTAQIFYPFHAKPYLVAVCLVGQLRSTFPNRRGGGILVTSPSGLLVIVLLHSDFQPQAVFADTDDMLHPQLVAFMSTVRFKGGIYLDFRVLLLWSKVVEICKTRRETKSPPPNLTLRALHVKGSASPHERPHTARSKCVKAPATTGTSRGQPETTPTVWFDLMQHALLSVSMIKTAYPFESSRIS